MIKKCVEGWNDFDVAIATPEAMSEVRKLGKVLGPRGLMPNPKTGTVTDDTAKAVKEVKAGPCRIQGGQGWQCSCRRWQSFISAEPDRRERPRGDRSGHQSPALQRARAYFMQSCTLSATMSPPVRVDLREFTAQQLTNF